MHVFLHKLAKSHSENRQISPRTQPISIARTDNPRSENCRFPARELPIPDARTADSRRENRRFTSREPSIPAPRAAYFRAKCRPFPLRAVPFPVFHPCNYLIFNVLFKTFDLSHFLVVGGHQSHPKNIHALRRCLTDVHIYHQRQLSRCLLA